MKNKKLLYILHIDWNWIYQRPQILAHYLESYFDVTVLSKIQVLSRKKMSPNTIQPRKKHHYFILPKSKSNRIMFFLTRLLEKLSMIKERISKKDVVWYCQPNIMNKYLRKCKGLVIYDCMDDYFAMENDKEVAEHIFECERRMCERANIIFVSSQSLANKLIARGADSKKMVLVRNGCDSFIFSKPKKAVIKDKYIIGYVGTIAEWMDFDLLIKSIEINSHVQYKLIGPNPKEFATSNASINFVGRVEHEKIYETIKDYDCLVMPFVVNEIIKSVDPVKLYEYISYGKCIISVYYDEIKRFSDFVYFYKTQEEYFTLLDKLSKTGFLPKYNESQQRDFLKNNSWDERGQCVYQAIKEKLSK